MAFFASLLAYLTTVIVVVAGLVMGFATFVAAPDQSTIPPQTETAAKPNAAVSAHATTSAKPATPAAAPSGSQIAHLRAGEKPSSEIKNPEIRSPRSKSAAFARYKTRIARETVREQDLPRFFRQLRANRWAYQEAAAPDFSSRYLGYVNDPAADQMQVR